MFSSLLIFGFILHKKYALMHLLEQLGTFYNDLCVQSGGASETCAPAMKYYSGIPTEIVRPET